MGSDKYRCVPAAGSAADQILARSTASASTTTPRVGRRAARPAIRTSSSSSPSPPRRPRRAGCTRTPAAEHRREPHAGQARDLLLRQQPGLVDHERRVRPEEGPRPQVLRRRFLWSGIDYIGEPTPYDVFPVKASFFGAVDTAGFPKDMYYLFRSQWTDEPDGPPAADELDRPQARRGRPGVGVLQRRHRRAVPQRPVAGHPPVRPQDHDGRPEVPGDDRGDPRRQDGDRRPVPGQLHEPERQRRQAAPDLDVPFAARQLEAVARGTARWSRATAATRPAQPDTVRLSPDKRRSPPTARASYVTADVVDSQRRHGPGADNPLTSRSPAARSPGSTTAARRAPRTTRRPTARRSTARRWRSYGRGRPPARSPSPVTSPGLRPATTVIRTSGGTKGAAVTEPVPVTPRRPRPDR